MIHNEQKKWFLYSTLPHNINKVFIYMPTVNYPECEKALEELTEYFKTTLDTIAKVNRIDIDKEAIPYCVSRDSFPIVLFDDTIIKHNVTDVTKAVSNYLPVVDIDLPTAEKVKALKDGKDLL